MWSLTVQMMERTSPGLNTAYNVVLGVCNEDADSATIDALLQGIRYSAARNVLGVAVANGVASSDANSNSAMRGMVATFTKTGLGATARLTSSVAFAVDAALATTAGALAAAGSQVGSFGDADPRLVIAFYRSATTAGTATGAYDFYAGLGSSFRAST